MNLLADMMGLPKIEKNFFIGDENGEPFVVRVQQGTWIPVSVLIFAQNGEDAIARVAKGVEAFQACAKKNLEGLPENWREERGFHESDWSSNRRLLDVSAEVLKLIAGGFVQSEKMDKRMITEAIWTTNKRLVN